MTATTPPPPDGVIQSFDAPVAPADYLRYQHIGNHILDRIYNGGYRGNEWQGHSTLELWNQTIVTARSIEAVVDCLVAHAPPDDFDDTIAQWQGIDPLDLNLDYVQAWAAVHRPGVLITPLAHALGQDWYDVNGVGLHIIPPRYVYPNADDYDDSELITNLAKRLRAVPPSPMFDWGDRVPRNEVTLFGAHGGMGKSTLQLMLAACAAAGRAYFGLPTRHQVVGFYSAEDGADIQLHRLGKICRALDIDPAELEGRLHIFDVTGADPVLYRQGRPTPRLEWLREQVQTLGIGLLVVDGASDVYDDSEISRPRVREFMRLLRGLGCTVILIAHIDKAAAKGDGSGQNYSGSTAWNNSARSRLALLPNSDGTMELVHEKSNHGPKQPPIRLTWCAGLPALAFDGAATGQDPTRALLELIAEFNTRGEYISTGSTSTSNAYRMLSKEPTFPKGLSRADVSYKLRQAERAGYLSNFEYKTQDRKTRKRWELTETGKALIAPTVAPASQG